MFGHNQSDSNKRPLSEAMETATKRARVDPRAVMPPSRVLHVRGIPADTLDTELQQAGQPFGRVTHVMVMRGKSQGFIEFADVESARAMIEYHTAVPALIRGVYPVHYQYSARTELTASGNNQNTQAHSVLLATVLNVVFPITIETMVTIFGRFGTVCKVILFSSKNGSTQCLLQYADVLSATVAKQQLDGQNIYQNCCTLRIQFSNLPELNVKYNNDHQRDLLNPYLPTGPSEGGADGAAHTPAAAAATYGAAVGFPGALTPQFGGLGLGVGMPGIDTGRPVVIVSNLNTELVTPDCLFTLFGVYGDVNRVKIMYNKKDVALVQFATSEQASSAIRHLNGCPLFGQMMSVNLSNHPSIAAPRSQDADSGELNHDYTNSPLHRFKIPASKNFKNICPPCAVLHLSNIPPDVSEADLSTLFSSYGTVVSFKFFENNRKMALVQMGDIDEAVRALIYLHNHRLGETNLKITFSRVQVPTATGGAAPAQPASA
eukprot:gnl/Spiro4/7522_TR3936_c0_g1_i1.p1 gnl/Spiro4/7522_TR3936_c0_g1~~gnl/Spiro4/7522_TR3936_c0_g1_i1.p1  ORF type:complete len:518 (+),score=121.47 gnl/Spiro4/7522_TR3936_c0_g1_i1:87-1556(+)